ncbi:MAG: TonB-dependent receptor [Nitrospinae bacterium]|nr:TonB-dependent receptor [Nitrospinota bacterium]
MSKFTVGIALALVLALDPFAAFAEEALQAANNEPASLEEVTVTGTREREKKSETPLSVGVLKNEDIRENRPSHPAEIMGKVPGVYVAVTGGEGHMTAIRHPVTTGPVYLFLEDGIPVRSTGFFNHNALYEVNIPQSGGIEVIKGPGTALYGSDAIGGVINVLTRPAAKEAELELNAEYGSFGWNRGMISGGQSGVRVDGNVTHSNGWRDKTAYDRQSATLRWDKGYDSGAKLKTVFAYSNIDQGTAGTSAISRSDYENNPTTNYTPISFRKVNAFRASTAYENESGSTLFSVTPYLRVNKMDIIPNWSLSYDPALYTTQNESFGLMAKYRMDFEPLRTRFIVGADGDYSPGSYYENKLTVTRTGSVYTAYTVGAAQYDYKVSFQGVSPYAHLEFSPSDKLRVNAGMRYDNMGYNYRNNLSTVTTGNKKRPADTNVSFTHLSPKLGLTYEFTEKLNGFLSYRHAFRAPSEGQLFRQGSAVSTVDLKPIKVDSYDLGVRGQMGRSFTYEITGYNMTKTDDIVSFTTSTGSTEQQNAGETSHRGVEAGFGVAMADEIRLDAAYSWSKHTYEKWLTAAGTDYSGKELSAAPNEVANVWLTYSPQYLGGGRYELSWVRVGSYWQDDANTHKYEGHNLLNFQVSSKFQNGLELYGKVNNLTDAKFATNSSYTTARGEELAPGTPRAYFVGVNYAFK